MPLTPNNREEHWLQGMVDGQTTLEPNKRREYWYKEIVDAIGSGGGGGGGALVKIGLTNNNGSLTMQKTLQEILDYIESGLVPYVNYDPSEGMTEGDFLITLFRAAGADVDEGGLITGYYVSFGDLYFECASLTDYPAAQ